MENKEENKEENKDKFKKLRKIHRFYDLFNNLFIIPIIIIPIISFKYQIILTCIIFLFHFSRDVLFLEIYENIDYENVDISKFNKIDKTCIKVAKILMHINFLMCSFLFIGTGYSNGSPIVKLLIFSVLVRLITIYLPRIVCIHTSNTFDQLVMSRVYFERGRNDIFKKEK